MTQITYMLRTDSCKRYDGSVLGERFSFRLRSTQKKNCPFLLVKINQKWVVLTECQTRFFDQGIYNIFLQIFFIELLTSSKQWIKANCNQNHKNGNTIFYIHSDSVVLKSGRYFERYSDVPSISVDLRLYFQNCTKWECIQAHGSSKRVINNLNST